MSLPPLALGLLLLGPKASSPGVRPARPPNPHPAVASAPPSAALEQALLCEQGEGDAALAGCRAGLLLGLPEPRGAAVRQLIAVRLAALERWDELLALYREKIEARPQDAQRWLQLGSALLFAAKNPLDALSALAEAARLAPEDPEPLVRSGVALNALGRHPEAVAAFEHARRLDPEVFDCLPGAEAVFEAARRGENWP